MVEPSPVDAGALAEAMLRVGRAAHTEEDVRIGVEKLLEPALAQLGVVAQAWYERRIPRTVLTAPGRADALYGQAVIEYEPPGKLSTAKGLASTRRQLEGYLLGLAGSGSQREAALRRIAGIGLDGQSIFFLRYRGDRPSAEEEGPKAPLTQLPLLVEEPPKGGFSLIGPFAITEESVNEFLLHLRALRRRPLGADELGKEFGPAGGVAHEMVNALYSRLEECLTAPGSQYPRVETLYEEWKRIFGIVYGQELVKAQRDAAALARRYHVTEFTDLKPLLFAVHTYYALFMKILAAEVLSLQQGALLASVAEQLPALAGDLLRGRLEELEKGTWFEAQGIRNFLEADFFGWYLSAWNAEMEAAVRSLARALAEYEPATATLAPESTRDLLKKLYQYLVPRELRHDLGEYYTPDWLAELVLNEVGYGGNPEERLLDPACGSGTFLVLAIRRVLDYAEGSLVWRARERELVAKILENVVGFDLNPLAVIAARTNYLLALGPLARHLAGKDLPVYLCDSILTPQTQRTQQRPIEHQKDIPVPSAQKEFWIPEELVDRGQVDALCRLLEQCVGGNYQTAEFLDRGQRELKWEDPLTERSLGELYRKVRRLEGEGRNGLWARLIKNAFAPVFRAAVPFDYVAGNPPWVLWGYLADEYRQATRRLWMDYGLFSLKGMAARLGSGEKDFSMLFTYACADAYLEEGGRLGFVITQEVFKAKGKGEGFRRFRLGEHGSHLRVLKAHDMVALKPFEGAANKTAAIVLEKGPETQYPVPYVVWRKRRGAGTLDASASLAEALGLTERQELQAWPIGERTEEAWQTTDVDRRRVLAELNGPCAYRAHIGARVDPYGVFLVRLLQVRPDGLLVVENMAELGKREVPSVREAIEPDLMHPIVRGRDVDRWRVQPEIYAVIPQDPVKRKGYPEARMKVEWPGTYAYLCNFRDILLGRGSKVVRQLAERTVFYTTFSVGPYTFAPYRVVWQGMARDMVAAVASKWTTPFGEKVLIAATNTTSFVASDTEREAHFICSLLNSAPCRLHLRSFSSAGRGFGTPSILEHVAIPKFEPSNPLHQSVASLSRRAHELAALGKEGEAELRSVEEDIDRLAAQLWGITGEEMEEIRRALAELA